jgi:hypothetical protein
MAVTTEAPRRRPGTGRVRAKGHRWQAGYSVTEYGRRREVTRTFDTRAAAVRWLADAIAAGRLVPWQPTAHRSVAEALAEWLTLRRLVGRRLRPSTLAGYVASYQNHIVPHIGHLPVAALRPEHVQALHRALAQPGASRRGRKVDGHGRYSILSDRALSPSARSNVHSVLSQGLRWCVENGLAERNVAAEVDPAVVVSPDVASTRRRYRHTRH